MTLHWHRTSPQCPPLWGWVTLWFSYQKGLHEDETEGVKPWISHAKGTWDASMLWAEYRGHHKATCSAESSFAKQIDLVFPLGQAQPLPCFILVNHLDGSELVGCLVLRRGDGLMYPLHVENHQ